MTKKCNYHKCNNQVPDKRKFCGHNCSCLHWNEHYKELRKSGKAVKKCLNCDKPTSKTADFCANGSKCYHEYYSRFDPNRISTADYDLLNRSFVGADDFCVVL